MSCARSASHALPGGGAGSRARAVLCVTGGETTTRQLAARLAAGRPFDMQEVRLDLLDHVDDEVLGLVGRRNVIATCRSSGERGGFRGTERERFALLTRALAHEPGYLDVELSSDRGLRQQLFGQRGLGIEQPEHGLELCLGHGRRPLAHPQHDARYLPPAELAQHARAGLHPPRQSGRNEVAERLAERYGDGDLGEQSHRPLPVCPGYGAGVYTPPSLRNVVPR